MLELRITAAQNVLLVAWDIFVSFWWKLCIEYLEDHGGHGIHVKTESCPTLLSKYLEAGSL